MLSEPSLLLPLPAGTLQVHAPIGLLAVFDGHGSPFTSSFLKKEVPAILGKKLACILEQEEGALLLGGEPLLSASADCLKRVMEETCQEAEGLLRNTPRMQLEVQHAEGGGQPTRSIVNPIDGSGSTACMCLVSPHFLVVANVGDSRAVLASYASAPSSPSSSSISSSSSSTGNSVIEVVWASTDHKPKLIEEIKRADRAGLA